MKMFTRKHRAVIVKKDDIKLFLQNNYTDNWLKKVKQVENNNFLVLISSKNISKFIYVDVPAFQPETDDEIGDADKLWPTIYKSKRIESPLPDCYKAILSESIRLSKNILQLNKCCASVCCFVWESNDSSIETKEIGSNSLRYFHSGMGFYKDHPILNAISDISKEQIGYLCTGMNVILDTEPCYCCAMAFVHGRMLNVFILNKKSKGIFSYYKFNYNKKTNHRFNVYFAYQPEI